MRSPLQVDTDKAGSDSDHNIVLLPPITLSDNRKRIKRSVVTRPLPQSGIEQFSLFINSHTWAEVLEEEDIDKKVENFHAILRKKSDEFLPDKLFKSLIWIKNG